MGVFLREGSPIHLFQKLAQGGKKGGGGGKALPKTTPKLFHHQRVGNALSVAEKGEGGKGKTGPPSSFSLTGEGEKEEKKKKGKNWFLLHTQTRKEGKTERKLKEFNTMPSPIPTLPGKSGGEKSPKTPIQILKP